MSKANGIFVGNGNDRILACRLCESSSGMILSMASTYVDCRRRRSVEGERMWLPLLVPGFRPVRSPALVRIVVGTILLLIATLTVDCRRSGRYPHLSRISAHVASSFVPIAVAIRILLTSSLRVGLSLPAPVQLQGTSALLLLMLADLISDGSIAASSNRRDGLNPLVKGSYDPGRL